MGIGPADAGRLTLHEYQGLLWHWNEAHKTDDERDAEKSTLDPARVRANLAAINAQNQATPLPV